MALTVTTWSLPLHLLAESDQNTPLKIDEGLANITRLVADAKGWSLENVGPSLQ
jgi:hypothetical protein